MSEVRDPLDALFDDPDGTPLGEKNEGSLTSEEPKKEPVVGEEADVDEELFVEPERVKMVPLAALEEARARAKAAEERLAKPPVVETPSEDTPEFKFPDPKEDPEGFADRVMGTLQFNALNQSLNISERMARKEHGRELVDKVREWALPKIETDPEFARKVLLDDDPYELAIGLYNEQQKTISNELPGLDDDEKAAILEMRKAKASAGEAETQPRGDGGQYASPRSRSPAAPTSRSLAHQGAAPGKGGGGKDSRAVGPGVAFDDTFG